MQPLFKGYANYINTIDTKLTYNAVCLNIVDVLYII